MKVVCIDTLSPRSDGIAGNPTGITVGQEYVVAEVLEQTAQYSIINDKQKLCRYSQYRFEVTDDTLVEPLRDAFNKLTIPLRQRIKELEKQLGEQNANSTK